MKKFEIFRYLKKWMPVIVIFLGIMTTLSYQLLKSRQTYTASAVIEYKTIVNNGASTNLAPDGSEIDVTEIYSSSNMARVMSNLGLSYDTYSLDALCASIKVVPVERESEKSDLKEEEPDETASSKPPAYIVSCTLGSSASNALVRDILNELLDVYFSDFSRQHINEEQVNNSTKDLADTDYDYLEMVERIDEQLQATHKALLSRYNRAQDFRSVDTGYSFIDLCNQLSLIQRIDVPKLYALVLGNQITKDRDLLINKYQNRVAKNELHSQKAQEDIADALNVIRSYVNKMRQSGNTDLDYNYILQDVHGEHWDTIGSVNRTVEYDELLRNWVSYRDQWDYAVINAAYCEYVIGVYRDGNTQLTADSQMREGRKQEGAEQDEQAETEAILEEAPVSVAVPEMERATVEEVEEYIREVLSRMNDVYSSASVMNVEYNEYLGAQTIRILSSASVSASINLRLYTAVIAVFFLLVGCGGAVLLGRAGDILEYMFLRDRLTGCMNRTSCDNYIEKWKNQPLSAEMCCCNIQITNQREMNETYGREQVDQAMKEFGRILRELFEDRRNGFVGYNGSGQFWVFFEKEPRQTVEQEIRHMILTLSQALSNVSLEYQLGWANAGELQQFWIRSLISQAVKNRMSRSTNDISGNGR